MSVLAPACSGGGTSDPGGASAESSGFELYASGVERRVPAPLAADVERFESDRTTFDLDLYHEIARQPEHVGQGFFFSPHSASMALAMAYAGARASTATEMQATLRFDPAEYDVHEGFNYVSRELSTREVEATADSGGLALVVQNDLWAHVDAAKRPLQSYVDTLAEHYGPVVKLVDFDDAERARSAINAEVERATAGKIDELLPEASIVAGVTTMVLTNSVYFKAAWLQPFEQALTRPEPFTTLAGASVPVPTMHLQSSFDYAEQDGVKVIRLPYVGNAISLTVILPAAGEFATVEAQLTTATLAQWQSALAPMQVDVRLPRLAMQTSLDVKKVLSAMGMSAPFEDDVADFSGIGPHQSYISDVLQQAFIDFNEAGTEAGAATAVVFADESEGPQAAAVFDADRPFIVLLRDEPTGALLFAGRYIGPEE